MSARKKHRVDFVVHADFTRLHLVKSTILLHQHLLLVIWNKTLSPPLTVVITTRYEYDTIMHNVRPAFKTYEYSHLRLSQVAKTDKKAQLTQGLRATAPRDSAARQRRHSKMAVSRHLRYYGTGKSAIRSTDPENPSLEPDIEWIGCTVCEIFNFKLYCDLETEVRGHSMSSKVALFDRAHIRLCIRLP